MHWDPTVSIGNVITMGLALVAIVFAWRDMDWRIKNLEGWRKEAIQDVVARAAMDEKFKAAVDEFKISIAALHATVAAMDKEYQRRISENRAERR